MLRIEFTKIAIWWAEMCPNDYVKITDEDGTTLMDRGCGYGPGNKASASYFLPPIITTLTNTVNIFFHTDGSGTQPGWSLKWTAVTPGLKPLLAIWTQKLPNSVNFQSGKLGKRTNPSTQLAGVGIFLSQGLSLKSSLDAPPPPLAHFLHKIFLFGCSR